MPSYFLIIPLPDEVKDRLVALQPRDLQVCDSLDVKKYT